MVQCSLFLFRCRVIVETINNKLESFSYRISNYTAVAKKLFFFDKNIYFDWSQMNFLVKNEFFGQKWIFWSKINFLVKNELSGQKWTFWSKMNFLVKNELFGLFWNVLVTVDQTIKLWPKTGQTLRVRLEIEKSKC